MVMMIESEDVLVFHWRSDENGDLVRFGVG
jgi:hypothetical protein